jgi:hypothetical protein
MMREYKDIPLEQMRSVVGRFGVTGNNQTLPIKQLSDGLKSRVVFAWLAQVGGRAGGRRGRPGCCTRCLCPLLLPPAPALATCSAAAVALVHHHHHHTTTTTTTTTTTIRGWRSARRTCCCWTSPPTTWTSRR